MRRRPKPKIAFIMFQDIIMAVFGVLILIVVYLLINLKFNTIETQRELEERLAESEQKASEAEQQLSDLDAMIELSSRSSTRLDLETRAQELREELDTLQQQEGALARELTTVNSEHREALEAFANHPMVLRALEDSSELQDSILRKRDRSNELTSTLEQLRWAVEIQTRIRISDDVDPAAVLYFVELVGGAMILHRDVGGEVGQTTYRNVRNVVNRIDRDPKEKHVMLFVRPSGEHFFGELREEFRRLDLPLGYQPVPEGEELYLLGRGSVEDAWEAALKGASEGGAEGPTTAGAGGTGTGEVGGAASADGEPAGAADSGDHDDVGTGGGNSTSAAEAADPVTDLGADVSDEEPTETRADEENRLKRNLFWLLVLLALLGTAIILIYRKR